MRYHYDVAYQKANDRSINRSRGSIMKEVKIRPMAIPGLGFSVLGFCISESVPPGPGSDDLSGQGLRQWYKDAFEVLDNCRCKSAPDRGSKSLLRPQKTELEQAAEDTGR